MTGSEIGVPQARLNPFPGAGLSSGLGLAALSATLFQAFVYDSASVFGTYVVGLALGIAVSTLVMGNGRPAARYSLRIFISSYSINVILVYLFAAYFISKTGAPFIPEIGHRNPDDAKFHLVGMALAEQWRGGINAPLGDPVLGFKYKGYPYLMGAIYWLSHYIGDVSPVSPRIINSMFGGLVIVLIYRIGALVYDERVARLAACLALLFPVWGYYSSMGLRDIIVAYLICQFTYNVLSIKNRQASAILNLTGAALALLGLFYFRTPIVYVALVSGAAYLVLAVKSLPIKAVLLSGGVLLYAVALFHGLVPGKEVVSALMNQADRWGGWRSSVVSTDSLAIRYIYQAPFLLHVPLLILYTAFMPVPPIQGFMLHHYFVGAGALMWYFYVPFWVHAMLTSVKYSRATFLTIFTLFIFIGIAVIQPDIRHKTQFFGLAFVQIAYSIVALKRVRSAIFLGVGIVGALLGFVYISLKL